MKNWLKAIGLVLWLPVSSVVLVAALITLPLPLSILVTVLILFIPLIYFIKTVLDETGEDK